MVEKCDPKYKNLNFIQSFSEGSYATVQLMRQICQNDEWLRQRVERLNYLSPPAIRKNLSIVDFVDEKQSYGCRGNGNNQIVFDDTTVQEPVIIDFTDDSLIDENLSDGSAKTLPIIYDDEGNPDKDVPLIRYEVPSNVETTDIPAEYEYFGTSKGGGVNSYWYVGWDKSKNYYVRPDWLKNWKDYEIKSVCRGQTFKAECTGLLESVDLKLDYNGSMNNDCGSPLYVQIWATYKRFVVKTKWDNESKQMRRVYIKYNDLPLKSRASESEIKRGQYRERYSNFTRYELYNKKLKYTTGKHKGEYKKDKKGNILTIKSYRVKENGEYVLKREYIQWLGHNKKKGVNSKGKAYYYTDIYHPLAEGVHKTGVGDPFPNIKFDKPCEVKKGQTYAIVVFSPLSEWKHCPRWGGWGRNCQRDAVYPNGNAFMSENNGRTWKRYGKNGADVDDKGKVLEYKKGRYTPQDFAFQCHVQTKLPSTDETVVYSQDEHYLYLKPIYSNPIRRIGLSVTDYGSESSVRNSVEIDYEFSTDGEEWTSITPNYDVELEEPSNVVLIRARLLSKDESTTPYIEKISVRLFTLPAKEMYARTSFYKPRTEAMLGANLWGRVYAPFNNEPTVDCTCEVILGKEVIDHFEFISVEDLDEVLNTLDIDNSDVSDIDDLNRAIYLTNNSNILEVLKQNNIYVLPYYDDNTLYLLSFASSYDIDDMIIDKEEDDDMFTDYNVGGIVFSNQVAHPIINVNLQSPETENNSSVDAFSQWINYTFDYDNNMLFFKKETLDNLVKGDLYVTYNPIFIDGLTNEEVGVHINDETGLSEQGLVLDYFKETFIINDVNVETRRVKLRVNPVDPIREVILNKDTDDEVELFEGFDYTLDIVENELVFEINNNDGYSSILKAGDVLQVVYTPNIEDDALSLGFYGKRSDTNRQVYIDNCYFEYKA